MNPVRSVFVADARVEPSLPEHSLVRTRVDLVEGDTRIPAGTIGTIVLAIPEKDGFEIEFDQPVQAVIGAWRHDIEPV